jgi:aspartyl-tRNA(Asn)/glutamyl-tRNA(Gln) amidotransferase subunit C
VGSAMPAPKIDRALVVRVASLASMSLAETDVDRFAYELARIVAYVEQLEGLDTSDVPPTAHVLIDRAPWRPDDLRPGLNRGEALSQAPVAEAEGFVVPAFVE